MKAFSEKSELILRTLSTSPDLSWDRFTQLTEITRNDAILIFLRNRGLIEYSQTGIKLINQVVISFPLTSL